jgi:hypothetical protein
MPDYVADDVASISRRMKEIQDEEKPIQNSNLESAVGRDLDFIAQDYGLRRNPGESDYHFTNRIRDARRSVAVMEISWEDWYK